MTHEGASILLVEDETDICEILKEVLEERGYRTDIATSGEDALARLERHPYRLLIVDVRLASRVSGIDVVRELRDVPSRPKVIVISATAKSLLVTKFDEQAVTDLVDRVLEKPTDLNPERFLEEVEALLR